MGELRLSLLADKQPMPVSHLKHNDPRHVIQADPVHEYVCTTCDAYQAAYGGAPFCDTCLKYMVEKHYIPINQVTEIKNREWTPDEDDSPENAGRMGRWDEKMVRKGLAGKVMARSGNGPDLQILVNMDREAFEFQQVLLRFGTTNVLTSVDEIGAMFAPFDSSSKTVKTGTNPDGSPILSEKPKPKPNGKVVVRLAGDITITGATSAKAWKDMWATFTMPDGTSSVFALPDICSVIVNAV